MMFKINIKGVAGYDKLKLVEFIGELTALESVDVSEELIPLIDKGHINLIGDLSKLEYINSTGILCLLRCHMRVIRHKGSFKLFGVKKEVLQVLKDAGITKLLPIYQTFDEVKESFSSPE